MPRLTKKQQDQVNKLSEADRKKIQKKYNLNKIPSAADVTELLETGSFAQSLYGGKKETKESTQKELEAPKSIQEQNKTSSPYESRDQYLQNLLKAQYGIFDKETELSLQSFTDKQQDLDIQNQYYNEDFAKITDRKTTDYFTGVALRNKEFSKSLDYVANVASRAIGSLRGIGASQITDSVNDKIEDDARIKLNFQRGMDDMKTDQERTQARYKLSSQRLDRSRKNYEDSRDTQRKVLGIETTGAVNQMYDTLTTDTILAEDEAYASRRNITGGGTGVENVFGY